MDIVQRVAERSQVSFSTANESLFLSRFRSIGLKNPYSVYCEKRRNSIFFRLAW